MHAWTLLSFFAFTALAAFLTWLITRRDEKGSSDGFFLGGRSLTFPIIAGSLLLTNLSTEQMVGLNGLAFKEGLSVMAWEVIAVLALVAMAMFFLPRFLRMGITTVPEFLESRFGKGAQVLGNMVFLIAYVGILLPIILYSGAVGLSGMLDLSTLTGIDEPVEIFGKTIPPGTVILWGTVILIGIMGSLYSRFGGLRTLAVLDTINGVGLLTGGLMITFYALNHVGDGQGIEAGWESVKAAQPDRLNSMGRSDQSVPFSTLFTGVALLHLFYWCTNQQIIQRTFGAKSLAEGQKGVLLCGLLKLLGPLFLVLPGLIAWQVYRGQDVAPDHAYGKLVFDLLPAPLTGFFAAVMVGAILSSFNAALNSTSALFSIGIYRGLLRPGGSEESMVRAAKIFVVITAITSMLIAPQLAGQKTIFEYLQKMNAIYFIPIFAVVVVGMLNRRVPSCAGVTGLVLGLVIIPAGYFHPPFKEFLKEHGIHEYHFLGIVFALLVLVMNLIGWVRPRPEPWVLVSRNRIDLTPWKNAKWAATALALLVVGIYAAFAG